MENRMSTILLIDDEEKVVRYYKKLLEGEGYHVIIATNAREGTMAVIREKDIDLILLDINMPEIDGRFLWDVIQEYNPRLKIMIFSVYSEEDQARMIPKALAYFDKSHSAGDFLKKIDGLASMN